MQPAPPRPRAAVGRHRDHRPAAGRRIRRGHRRPPAAQRAELAAQGRRRWPARRRGRRPAGHQPPGPGRLPSPPGRRLPAAHAHRRRGAATPRRGPRPGRAMDNRGPGHDQPGRRPAAGAGLRHLAGDAPAARQRRSRRPAAHPHCARPQQHPRRREPARLAPRPRHHAGRLRASRHRSMAAHRAIGLPGQGLPGLGRRARPLPAADHTPAAAGGRPRHQPGPAVGAGRPAAARRGQRSTPPTGLRGACCCSTASRCPASPP